MLKLTSLLLVTGVLVLGGCASGGGGETIMGPRDPGDMGQAPPTAQVDSTRPVPLDNR